MRAAPGSKRPSFSRGKRGIAGSLIWINFDRHALLSIIRRSAGSFVANIDDIAPSFRYTGEQIGGTAIFNSSVGRSTGVPIGSTIDQVEVALNEVQGFKELATPWFSDQVMPFDITLAGSNEYGAASAMKLFGVELLNEGSGV